MPNEKEYKNESFSTERYPDARKRRDALARQLRAEGWTVKCKKVSFSGFGYGDAYSLEAERELKQEVVGGRSD
jgi:hypothetical protein